MELGIWWIGGFGLSLAARFFLVDYAGSLGRAPLTWGGVIICAVTGILGPFVLAPLVIWFLCWLSDHSDHRYGWKGFFSRPVFGQRKPR